MYFFGVEDRGELHERLRDLAFLEYEEFVDVAVTREAVVEHVVRDVSEDGVVDADEQHAGGLGVRRFA